MKRKIKLTACLMALIATVAFGFTGCMYIDGNDGQWHSWGPNCNDPNFTGMDCNEYGWWYFKNGVIDWNYTGMACNDNGWWYFRNGQIDWGYTGMACNQYGWWYYQNGRLDWGYNGFGFNGYGGWLYQNGTIAWNYTGDYGNYYIKGGHLDHEHFYITKNAKNATCSQNGYTGDTVCKHCSKVAKRGSSTAKLNHSYETRNAKEATCLARGYTGDTVCKNCGYVAQKGSFIAQKNHKFNSERVNKKYETTEEEGYTGDLVCEDCGVFSYGERRPKLIDKQHYDTQKLQFFNGYADGQKQRIGVVKDVDMDFQSLYAGKTLSDYVLINGPITNTPSNNLCVNNSYYYTHLSTCFHDGSGGDIYSSLSDALNETNPIDRSISDNNIAKENQSYYVKLTIAPALITKRADGTVTEDCTLFDSTNMPVFAKNKTNINLKTSKGVEIVYADEAWSENSLYKSSTGLNDKFTGKLTYVLKITALPNTPYNIIFPTLKDGQVLDENELCPLDFVYDMRNGKISRYRIEITDITDKKTLVWGQGARTSNKQTMKITKDHEYWIAFQIYNHNHDFNISEMPSPQNIKNIAVRGKYNTVYKTNCSANDHAMYCSAVVYVK